MRVLFNLFASAALVGGVMLLPAALVSASTDGTWEQYPTGATEYQAEVQQPINTMNTSNWSSKSKGGIPVMYKLSSRVGPAAFESIGSDANTANDYAYMSFTPAATSPLTFNQITTLKTDYTFTLGDCHGGSLRWSVRTSPTQSVFIYYGALPQFGNGGVNGCTPTSTLGTDQSGVNMINQPDLRYDTSQYVGGTFYDSYAHAQFLVGTATVIRASLVIDSGWGGDQRLNVSNTTVNESVYQFVSSAGGSFSPTCSLPAATIEVGKNAVVTSGDTNEVAVQGSLADDGNAFRVVDCKYQYVLSIPSLSGKGTYEVQIWINGVRVPTPSSPGGQVKFDIV
jgi:hypothetical protein